MIKQYWNSVIWKYREFSIDLVGQLFAFIFDIDGQLIILTLSCGVLFIHV